MKPAARKLAERQEGRYIVSYGFWKRQSTYKRTNQTYYQVLEFIESVRRDGDGRGMYAPSVEIHDTRTGKTYNAGNFKDHL